MKVKARGWNRDMGNNTIGDVDLTEVPIKRDEKKSISWNAPGFFGLNGDVHIAWKQTLRLGGDYRVQIDLSRDEVARIFKASFGSELDVDLIEKYGFKISPELERAILAKVNIANLTLGDLAKLAGPAKAEEPKPEVVPFRRRI